MGSAMMLIVDYEPDHRPMIWRWLEDDEDEVFTSDNGWEASDALMRRQPALTVTNIH